MQMIALKPKEAYKLCADGSNAGRNGVKLECCERTFPCGVLHGYAGGL
jgi:hypothetical protein